MLNGLLLERLQCHGHEECLLFFFSLNLQQYAGPVAWSVADIARFEPFLSQHNAGCRYQWVICVNTSELDGQGNVLHHVNQGVCANYPVTMPSVAFTLHVWALSECTRSSSFSLYGSRDDELGPLILAAVRHTACAWWQLGHFSAHCRPSWRIWL